MEIGFRQGLAGWYLSLTSCSLRGITFQAQAAGCVIIMCQSLSLMVPVPTFGVPSFAPPPGADNVTVIVSEDSGNASSVVAI